MSRTAKAGVALLVVMAAVAGLGMAAAGYHDIRGHWAEQSLTEATARGILLGYPDGSIRPDAGVTRAQFAAIVCRALGMQDDAEVAARMLPAFGDLASDHWALGYFRVLKELGVLLGDDAGMARPDAPILRSEMATIAGRLLNHLNLQVTPSVPSPYVDEAAIPSWALDAVRTVSSANVMRGDDEARFRPNVGSTRAEALTVLLRLLDLQGTRWDIQGSVASIQLETGTLRLAIGQDEISIRCNDDTSLFSNGRRVMLSQVKRDQSVSLILRSDEGPVAAVVVIE